MSPDLSLNEDDVRAILDGMVDGIITINDKGIILSFNKTAETMFGYKTNEVAGENVSMLMPSPDSNHHDKYLNDYNQGGKEHIIGLGRDVTALRKNGDTFPMRLSVIEYPAKIKGQRWFIGSCLDITLQKQQEEQLRQSVKMEALGKLTSGISHDYNNMLGIILGYAGLLIRRYPDDHVVQEYAKEIKHAGERGRDLTLKLLSFSSSRPQPNKAVCVNDILSDNLKMLEKILTSTISVDLKINNDLWPVSIDRGCFEDMILNISINAMHAMPEGGKLSFATTNIKIGSIDSQVLNIKEGDYVKLSISDTGIGMPEEIKSRIFEPFFTTKKDKGTGLGLSQVYAFVKESKGSLKVYSEPGHGTCFSINLPRHVDLDNKEIIDEQRSDNVVYSGSGNILIIDDEKAILNISEEILSSAGYNVICQTDVQQALEILEKESFDLVISDVIMPEMNGFELAHIIMHKYPNTKIQLCSGFPEHHGKTVTNDKLYKNILQKPFSSDELLKCVNKLLRVASV